MGSNPNESNVEYRCFVGGLAWATTDERLENAFRQFGEVVECKVNYWRLNCHRRVFLVLNCL